MPSNISNWSIFIGGDASGGIEALRSTAKEAQITGQQIAEVGKRAAESKSGFEAMAEGIRRVAKQQELLDARRMKSQSATPGRGGTDPIAASMARASDPRLRFRAGISNAADAIQEGRGSTASQANLFNAEQARVREMAAFRADIIARSAAQEIAARENAASRQIQITQDLRQAQDNAANSEASQLRDSAALRQEIIARLTEQVRLEREIAAAQSASRVIQSEQSVRAEQANAHNEEAQHARNMVALRNDLIARLTEQVRLERELAAATAMQEHLATSGIRFGAGSTANQRQTPGANTDDEQSAMEFARLRNDIEERAADELQQKVRRARELDHKARMRSVQEDLSAREIANNRVNTQQQAAEELRGRVARRVAERNSTFIIGEIRRQQNARIAAEELSGRVARRVAERNSALIMAQIRRQQAAASAPPIQQGQQSFVGSRRAGFAAQQFGYAIEDAASVYGTMGLAGAFRAAGNNLTVMAAQLGPMAGTVASLAAAAVSLGINFYNAKQKAEELKKAVDKLNESRDKFVTENTRELELEGQLRSARAAGLTEMKGLYETLAASIDRLSIQMQAATRSKEQTAAAEEAMKRIEELNKQAAERTSQWWSNNFRTVITGWESVRDAVIGTALIIDDVATHVSAVGESLMSGNIRGARRAGDKAMADRRKMQRDQDNAANSLEAKLRLQEKALKDLLDPEKQRLRLMEEQAALQKDIGTTIPTPAEGKEAFEIATTTIIGRFEGLNEELRIENELVRVHERINDQLDIAVRSGRINRDQATAFKNDLIDATNAEEERLNTVREIDRLKKKETTIEGRVKDALRPATVLGGLTKGSDEARAFLENERLRSMAQSDAEPQIKELKLIREEIKRLRASNEKISQAAPGVVTLI